MKNRVNDTLNKKFNRLFVISVSHQDKHWNYHYNCKCDCGNELVVNGHKIRTGHTQSCGCLQKENTSKAKEGYSDLVGKKFGRLTVIEQVDKKIGKHGQPIVYLKCKCDCGKEKVLKHKAFLPGERQQTESCGCLQKETMSNILKRWKSKELSKFASSVRGNINGAISRRGFHKSISSEKLLGCTVEEFCLYIESFFQTGMSWSNYGNRPGQWSLDHTCPCSQAQNEEEVLALQNFKNFKPMFHLDNISKSASKTEEVEKLCKVLLNRDWIEYTQTEFSIK